MPSTKLCCKFGTEAMVPSALTFSPKFFRISESASREDANIY